MVFSISILPSCSSFLLPPCLPDPASSLVKEDEDGDDNEDKGDVPSHWWVATSKVGLEE